MGSQIGRLRERLVALVAFVRLLARMRSHVRFERARPRIGLVAHAAPVYSIISSLTPIAAVAVARVMMMMVVVTAAAVAAERIWCIIVVVVVVGCCGSS